MSYILDALRKAESEREREASAIGAALSAPAQPAASAPPLWQRLLPGLGAGLGLGLAVVLAWYGLRPATSPVIHKAPEPPLPQRKVQAPVVTPQAAPSSTVSATAVTAGDSDIVQIPTPSASSQARSSRTVARDERPPAPESVPELPDEVRRSLPPLTFGGAMYSDKPSSRMLVINGRVFHEGETIAPDLTLETIQLKSAVLRLRGQRYSVTY